MNTFNRVVVALEGLLVGVGALAMLTVALGAVVPAQVVPAGPWQELLQQLPGLDGDARVIAVSVLVVAAVVGLALLLLELRPSRRREASPPGRAAPAPVLYTPGGAVGGKWLRLRHDNTGTVSVDLESVRELALSAAAQVDAMRIAAVELDETDRGLCAVVEATVEPRADLAQAGDLLRAAVRDTLERRLGVTVAGVDVRAQLASPQKRAA